MTATPERVAVCGSRNCHGYCLTLLSTSAVPV